MIQEIHAIYKGLRIEKVFLHSQWKKLEDGIVSLVIFKETGRTIIDGADWFMWWGQEFDVEFIPSTNEWGTWEAKPAGCSACIKKAGGRMKDEEYQEHAALAQSLRR